MTLLRAASGPPLFAAVLGTRVRLELATRASCAPDPGGVTGSTIEVDLVAVDSVGVYGSLVGLAPLLEFWPWHRITGASSVKVQGELLEDRGSAAGAGAAPSAANTAAAPGDVPDPSELRGF